MSSLTLHAQVRMQQRGIPRIVVDLLLEFGARSRAEGGAWKRYFDGKAWRRIMAYCGKEIGRRIQEFDNVYVVESDAGDVVTTGYLTRRVKRG